MPAACASEASEAAQYQTAFAHDPGLHDYIDRLLQHITNSPSLILDIGCGTGSPVAARIAAAGHNIHGIDFSAAMVEMSRKNVPPPARFEQANMLNWRPNPPDKQFDAVLSILSLFLLCREEFEVMADHWAAWVKPGGILGIVSFPAEDLKAAETMGAWDTDGLCVRGVPSQFLGERQEVTYFTRDGWRALLESRGFELVDTQTCLFVPPLQSMCDPEIHYFMIAKRRAR